MPVKQPKFTSEAELCREFLGSIPKGWTAYPETGFDILLVREDGVQIGIEAKLSLNAAVVLQACDSFYPAKSGGPDFRAVLVPSQSPLGLEPICRKLGITVIMQSHPMSPHYQRGYAFHPSLPQINTRGINFGSGMDVDHLDGETWFDHCPLNRCPVPDYVPDVRAGVASPRRLTDWKIRAIKLAVLLEKRGYVTIATFNALRMSPRIWVDSGWLVRSDRRGCFVAGAVPDFRAQHPVNFLEIEADFEKWAPEEQLLL